MSAERSQSQVSEGIPGSKICWNGGDCSGSVYIHGDGTFHFIMDEGQSFDGCPPSGAVLQVPRRMGLQDRYFETYEIEAFDVSGFPGARNFRAKKLKTLIIRFLNRLLNLCPLVP